MNASRAPWALVERAAAFAILVPALVFALRYGRLMATTSLWTDELWAMDLYTSRGPVFAATDYTDVGNHIFFSVLSSALPGRASVLPLRARVVSFAAVALLLAGLAAFFLRRGAPLVAAVAVSLFAGSETFLDLALQARGYGLAAFLALPLSAGAVLFLETGSRRALALCAVAGVLGSWTLPTFGFLAAPVILLLLLLRPGRPTLTAALASLAGVLALHAFVLRSMLREMGTYSVRWGRQFSTLDSVAESVKLFALRSLPYFGDPLVLALLAGFPLALALAPPDGRRRRAPAALLLAAVAAFYVVCLALGTPLVRATSFAGVPLALGALLCLVPDRLPPAGPARAAASVGAALLLVPATVRWNREMAFVPMEAWRETAEVVGRLFPDRMPVFADSDAVFLRKHLPGNLPVVARMNPSRFVAGDLVLVDSPVTEPSERLVAQNFFPTLGELRIGQRRARYQAILFAPAVPSGIARASAGTHDVRPLLSDRDGATWAPGAAEGEGGARLALDLEPDLPVRSLVLLWAKGHAQPPADARIWTPGAGVEEVPARHWGRTTVLFLDGRKGARVLLSRRPGAPPLALAEAWAYPDARR